MKKFYFVFICSALFCIGCAPNENTNTARNASNSTSVSNSLGNAANTVANTVSNATGIGAAAKPDEFMKEAAMGGMSEVELGKLAASKAASAEVKKFGQMMVNDHSKANTELKALAAKKNVTLPSDLDSSAKSLLEELKAKTGADFDKEYVEEMVDDHKKDVAEFEKQSQSSTDPDVKAFAAKTLPTLKKHLDAIKAIQAKMK